jgi:hypothetical protein
MATAALAAVAAPQVIAFSENNRRAFNVKINALDQLNFYRV